MNPGYVNQSGGGRSIDRVEWATAVEEVSATGAPGEEIEAISRFHTLEEARGYPRSRGEGGR